ncbi:GNAT family N-acetyltransferase [Nonomuraea jabiensis]|uniref:Ribosomal protein S18 acetylase RimI-like enzyme n=1 Tax=Nonomuraea jabiensis TaxID=882448 RepID=A0A7W9GC31_9ACTN|nr:GNAT family N-acetyltransferase [Nonomuraea jabiensis]MBB5780936.1 ribosomal protein S18 acetylase RimI-like enzyme [Nonomuraea jabiensis]
MHHTLGRPRLADAPAIHELIAAYDTAVIGSPDMTLDDVADELAELGFDRDRDGWLARDGDGRLDGWAWACRVGDSDTVNVEVIVRPGVTGLDDRLWPLVIGRAGELAAEAGHDGATLHIGVYRADTAKRATAQARGFEPGTSFHRMRIDHSTGGSAEPLAPLAGLTLHTGESEDARREAHRVHQEGFAEHFGFVPVDYDAWYSRRQSQSTTDWSQLTLARLDGRPAGVLIANNQFVPDEGCGYVATLAVVPEFRGRGLGRFLLRHAFAADAARGRKGTILHVDSNNTTPALGLYESAGMRPVLVIDVWQRRV